MIEVPLWFICFGFLYCVGRAIEIVFFPTPNVTKHWVAHFSSLPYMNPK